jgi:peptidoglycan/LPS O-acetylase OafA/YrhL
MQASRTAAAREKARLIAELGVAFAGFVAIFLIFARREGHFSPADSLRIRSIILSSLFAVFISLVPMVLHHLELRSTSLWRVASAAALIGGLLPGGLVAREHLALSRVDRREVGAVHSFVSWGLFAVAVALYASNVFEFPWVSSAWPYLAALVCVLGIAASNFVTIAFQRLL